MPTKNNILIIKNPYESQGYGGGEVHTMALANYLRSLGDRVYFAGTCPDLLSAAKKQKFEVFDIDFGGQEAVAFWPLLKFIFSWPFIHAKYKNFLIKLQKEKNINILYLISWNEKFLLTPIARKLGMKVIFIEHRLLENYIFLNPFRLFYISATKYAKVIAVSHEVEKGLIKLGADPKNIFLIHNGIDTDRFLQKKDRLIEKKDNNLNIGLISRLSEEKGIKYLLEAFSQINRKTVDKDLKLFIAGDGPQKYKLINLCKSYNIEKKVKFFGQVGANNIPSFLNSIDIFVLPSLSESFGLVLAEAGIMGIPSVATCVGGIPEIVENNVTGIIVKPADADAIAKAIMRLADDEKLRKQMGNKARERIKKYFSEKIMLEKINKLMNT